MGRCVQMKRLGVRHGDGCLGLSRCCRLEDVGTVGCNVAVAVIHRRLLSGVSVHVVGELGLS